MSPDCSGHCLKDFLAAKAADSAFVQNAGERPADLDILLKNALRHFAAPWLSQRQAASQPAPVDALGFPSTMWTVVRIAGSAEDEIRVHALEILLRKYRPALNAFLVASARRKFGVSEEWINDCLQAFIAEQVLQKELIRKVNSERGRFRDLLKKSLYNFAISLLRKEQPHRFQSLDESEEQYHHELPAPEEIQASAADVEWARRIIVDALHRMMSQCAQKHQYVTKAVFERRRLMPLLQARKPESLEETAQFLLDTFKEILPIKKVSEQQVLGDKKFRRFLDDVLSEYCRDAAEIEEERQHLMDILQNDLNRGGGVAIEMELERLMEILHRGMPH
jgi:hypothetical protein